MALGMCKLAQGCYLVRLAVSQSWI